jgi:hypothetical protein
MTDVLPGPVDQSSWRAANAHWIASSLQLLRLRLERQAISDRDVGDVLSDWLVGDGSQRAAHGPADRATAEGLAALDSAIATQAQTLEELAAAMSGGWGPPALSILATAAGLSDLESQVLLLAAAPSLDGAFAAAFAQVQGDSSRDRATLHLALRLMRPGVDAVAAADILLPDHPLRRLELVTLQTEAEEPRLLRPLSVDDRVADYLRGINRIDERLWGLLRPAPGRRDGEENDVASSVVRLLAERLVADPERWPTVNLVGPWDAGGCAVGARAAAAVGLNPYLLEVPRLAELDSDRQTMVIRLLGREAVLGDLAAIIPALRTEAGSPEARTVDALVENLNAPLVVVSDARWPAAYISLDVLPVRRPSRAEQQTLWRKALARHPNSVNGELEALVQQFDFGPVAIDEVVDRAARDAEQITGGALWEACRVQVAPPLDQLARHIEPVWGWDDIVLQPDVRAQLHELADQVQHRAQVYEAWGFGAGLGRGRGITALFAGQSGTGKTMAAEIIARHLHLDLFRVDLAGVVSKYVGETEKNLRQVFDAAQSSGAILLFDEADALFGTRTEVRDSHDRYANLEINYLLQAMEDYAGLAILATNRRSALDAAFLRRLRFIVDFPFPDAQARRQIWERVFPPAAGLNELDFGFLSRLELAGGSIRAIAINAAFLAAADGSAIGMPHVVRAVVREFGKLSRPVSSAEFGEWLQVAR